MMGQQVADMVTHASLRIAVAFPDELRGSKQTDHELPADIKAQQRHRHFSARHVSRCSQDASRRMVAVDQNADIAKKRVAGGSWIPVKQPRSSRGIADVTESEH